MKKAKCHSSFNGFYSNEYQLQKHSTQNYLILVKQKKVKTKQQINTATMIVMTMIVTTARFGHHFSSTYRIRALIKSSVYAVSQGLVTSQAFSLMSIDMGGENDV